MPHSKTPLVLFAALAACRPAPAPSAVESAPPPSSTAVASASAPVRSVPAPVASAPAPVASVMPVVPNAADAAVQTETGYLERHANGCTWNFSEYCCPPRAHCKPTPPAQDVPCPPLAPVQAGAPRDVDSDVYKEMRVDRTCWSGPHPRKLHRSLCCHERYKF